MIRDTVSAKRPTDSRGSSAVPTSIDPAKFQRMDQPTAVCGTGDFNVVFIGAGNVMFGSDEGPWNHSLRFEQKLGTRLKVVAVIDPAIERAEIVLKAKCGSSVAPAYQNSRIFESLDEYIKNKSEVDQPRAFVIGSPPMFRGSVHPGRDVELQILKHFPGVAVFCEKPIATGPKDEITELFAVAKQVKDSGVVFSVGYMLRYLKAVQMMKRILEENNVTVMCTVARYACAYESIAKPEWWDKSLSNGPIIEQGTHFCDLSRYFGGEVDISTVAANSLEWNETAGHLSKLRIDESKIAPENRISRVTSANWKYESGAVGSLTHTVALQGVNYSCELEVFADGYQLKLVNPYVEPILYVRRPGDDFDETHQFEGDDPFFTEVSNWIDIVEDIEHDPKAPLILSSFTDACKTYEFTWAIREASERSLQNRKKSSAVDKTTS
ncbi:hypothetical protein BD410DRAFT_62189 [Rickenella mellea]|uniref:Oxidoreductase C terminal-domain-containing protein n=1 Tax=Rickenella mellea TaxID=50990 RepID=A0A4Y7QBZ9_9AGAM|nr:hypothetical protein BD410DRAFT_62189 [Rickenella mellea]